jgi:hypothetical protein
MPTIQHPNKIHENNVNNAEMLRQGGVSAAIAAGGGSATVKAAVAAAEAAYYRSVIASCLTHGVEAGGFRQGLYSITGQWS